MVKYNSKLIYHMWIPGVIKESYVDLMNFHFSHIKRYSHIFSEALFVLAMDNTKDVETINKVEKYLVGLGFNNVSFKIMENDPINREVPTFFKYVVNDIFNYDGLLFFAHNKGVVNVDTGNYEKYSCDVDNVKEWVSFMYYMDLERYDEIIHNLYGYPYKCAGTLLIKNEVLCGSNKYKWIFGGSFQWINCPALKDYIKINNLEIPTAYNRLAAEQFLGDILPLNFDDFVIFTDEWKWFRDCPSPYENIDSMIQFLLVGEKLDAFYNYYNENRNEKCINTVF